MVSVKCGHRRKRPTLFLRDRLVPIGERASDLVRRIFLDKVNALDRDLALIRPSPAILALRAGEDRAGLGVDEQLRRRALLEPFRIAVSDSDDIRGFALERNFARPRERRAPRFARLRKRLS